MNVWSWYSKLKLASANSKIQYGYQVVIFELALLKITRLQPIATNNMHMKFEIEVPKRMSYVPETMPSNP